MPVRAQGGRIANLKNVNRRKQMKKKGFTLVELLVVIAIIALLMGILMPALARVRMIAYRMVCGSNLSGIGKAILLYAGDSQETYPMPGWTSLPVIYAYQKQQLNEWDGKNGDPQSTVFGGTAAVTGSGGAATIGSLFYMLVRYQDVTTKQFNCKGDSGSDIFKLTSITGTAATTVTDLTKVYDFGNKPGKYCSYAYNFPFSRDSKTPTTGFVIATSSAPGTPIAADRNPGLDKNASTYIKGGDNGGAVQVSSSQVDDSPCTYWVQNNCQYVDKDFLYNSYPHQREGQNVLYNDGHTKFEATANVGINSDNIYQRWDTTDWSQFGVSTVPLKKYLEACGRLPALNSANPPTQDNAYTDLVPGDITDSLLVNDILDGGGK